MAYTYGVGARALLTTFLMLAVAGCGRLGFSAVSGLEDGDGGIRRDGGGNQPGLGDSGTGPSFDAGATPEPTGQDAGALIPDAGTPPPVGLDAGGPDVGGPDAGRPDAGRPDAGRPDAGRPDAGQPLIGCAAQSGVLACEDFEAGNPSSPWSRSGTGSFSRLAQTSARGGFVGRFQTAPGTRATFQRTIAPIRTGDDIYLRAFVRVDADAAASWNVLLQAESAAFNAKTSLDFTATARLHATRSSTAFLGSAFPTRQWACIEAHFFLSASSGRIDVEVNGSSVGNLTGRNTAVPSEGLTNLFFGIIADSGNTANLRVDYDDIVFSRNPIGC